MSENNPPSKSGWSSAQVYILSAICLLIGISVGYLFRGSNAVSPAAAPAQTEKQASNPAGTLPASPTQPSASDMKRMADKQVEPLLAELKSKPNDAAILAQIAHYYEVAGQAKDAATYYEKEVAVKPTAPALINLANAYYYAGSGDKAIDALNKALTIEPTSADALYDLGMLKWQLKNDPKGAIDCWERLLKANPHHPRRADVEKMIARAKEHAKMPADRKAAQPSM